MTSRFFLSVCVLLVVGGCDVLSQASPRKSSEKYSACLVSAAAGSSNLSLDNIRSLCAEASGVLNVNYSYDKSGAILPLNDFTRCYEKEKKGLEAKGVTTATRLAKLSCKYPDVE